MEEYCAELEFGLTTILTLTSPTHSTLDHPDAHLVPPVLAPVSQGGRLALGAPSTPTSPGIWSPGSRAQAAGRRHPLAFQVFRAVLSLLRHSLLKYGGSGGGISACRIMFLGVISYGTVFGPMANDTQISNKAKRKQKQLKADEGFMCYHKPS